MEDRIVNTDMGDRILNAANGPRVRAMAAVLCSFVGVPALILALAVLLNGNALGLLPLLFAVVTLAIALVLTLSVVIEAERATDTDPDTDTHSTDPFENQPTDTPSEDPIAMLQMRYARGELTDQEFEHHLERLLETEPEADPLMEWAD